MRASVDLEGVGAADAFDRFVSDFAGSLRARGLEFIPGDRGRLDEGGAVVGKVTRWEPGRAVEIDWRPSSAWGDGSKSKITISFEPLDGGTRLVFETDAPAALLGDRGPLLSDWFIDEVLAGATQAVSPSRFATWLTDRRARKPAGVEARTTYRDPVYHRPNFKAILHRLDLRDDDVLLEVGCGGGAFLSEALERGCTAAGVDHSADMVDVAREANRKAVAEGRLEIREAEAESLPFPDRQFTCVVCTGVFALVSDPAKVMAEMHRVLRGRGRVVLFTDSEELRGTEAAPEPIASHSKFFSDEELVQMALEAGFAEAEVERPDLGPYAREAGLSDELVRMFSGPGQCQLLLAQNA
ncbi:MAG: methyltransferase domain-containing protein [Nitrososphaerota archaeon]|nr:methyltransferase domain-containing protein [Nitrososphaerota archaeon]